MTRQRWYSALVLSSLHILLTYRCTHECDHCFCFSSPRAQGTFTLAKVRAVLDQAVELGTIDSIYFEGGEPFLYYPLLIEAINAARSRSFTVGIVTNSYWGESEADIEIWLRPMRNLGVTDLCVSDDALHHGDGDSPAARVRVVADRLGIPGGAICLEAPTGADDDVMLRGRAALTMTDGLPRRPAADFTACSGEELVAPARVHLDAYGNVHICQGVLMGNLWQRRLVELVGGYVASDHPICGPLVAGGPARLAAQYEVVCQDCVSACHLCYSTRARLRGRFPEFLGPPQLYGVE